MFGLWCSDSDNMKLLNSSSLFATMGCTNFKIGALRSHDIHVSTSHHDVLKACFVKKQPAAAPLARALQIVSEEVQNKLKKLFEIAYFVAKSKLPFSTYANLQQNTVWKY